MQASFLNRSALRLVALLGIAGLCLAGLAACSVEVGQPTVIQPTNGISVPVRVVRSPGGGVHLLADVTIDGHGPYTFEIDTGADGSLIDSGVTQKLHLPQAGPPQQVYGLSGSEQAIPVTVHSWQLGTIRLPESILDSASIASASPDGENIDGLIGSDILSQFGAITISYDASTLTVYKQIARAGVLPAS
jgi:predicted aspartyl protease